MADSFTAQDPAPGPERSRITKRASRARGRRLRVVAALTVVGGLTGTVTSSASFAADDGAPTSPKRQEAAFTSPFTGLPAEKNPVLAVKIDNHKDARPQTALEDADIVGVEKVEGGLGRLFAIYSSHYPESLGPVRSAREYNVEQMRMFQRPALAYSGARAGVVDKIKESPLYGVSHDDHPDAYERGGDHEPPHNLYGHPDKLLAKAQGASEADDIGFRFGAEPGGGTPTDGRTVDYGSSSVSFDWSSEEDRWLASFDGEPAKGTSGKLLGGKTVIIQKTDMPPDSSGETPYIETVGSGEATVLRDGKAFETKWQRKSATGDTTYTLSNGKRMPFDPGQVWLVYQER
ncbi:DUF3048 domain-containing protein [Streptomyces reniochalinae]|uniref:DUF3048 domain-containing protein n=1 Tax=Streptomyces reniochalinae TaxID=2250578 RepID=A0A367EIJ2_9ACTN|nr:DUF3048 domain-containing protein [Streptomyces reniochalinae]RCG17532.1 DUF3048 domain-containing protein [Streptomyces reniochalinae]